MCGIGVAVDTSDRGRAVPWALPLMRHRGPDGEGTLSFGVGQVDLEHCRLAIIDPENPQAAQPFSDPSGRWILLYNGELFNYKELRRELISRGIEFGTDSDTEVVLKSYIANGEQALKDFRGMFALVVWDRETGKV